MKTGKNETYPWCASAASRLNSGGFFSPRPNKQGPAKVPFISFDLYGGSVCSASGACCLPKSWFSGKSGSVEQADAKPQQQGNHSSRGAAQVPTPTRPIKALHKISFKASEATQKQFIHLIIHFFKWLFNLAPTDSFFNWIIFKVSFRTSRIYVLICCFCLINKNQIFRQMFLRRLNRLSELSQSVAGILE